MSHVIDLSNSSVQVTNRRLSDEPGRVTKGDPHQNIALHYRHPDGRAAAGTWISSPGRWHAFTGQVEFCHILRGRCALIHENGTRTEFGPGDSFLIPRGFRGEWEVMETCEKHFFILHDPVTGP